MGTVTPVAPRPSASGGPAGSKPAEPAGDAFATLLGPGPHGAAGRVCETGRQPQQRPHERPDRPAEARRGPSRPSDARPAAGASPKAEEARLERDGAACGDPAEPAAEHSEEGTPSSPTVGADAPVAELSPAQVAAAAQVVAAAPLLAAAPRAFPGTAPGTPGEAAATPEVPGGMDARTMAVTAGLVSTQAEPATVTGSQTAAPQPAPAGATALHRPAAQQPTGTQDEGTRAPADDAPASHASASHAPASDAPAPATPAPEAQPGTAAAATPPTHRPEQHPERDAQRAAQGTAAVDGPSAIVVGPGPDRVAAPSPTAAASTAASRVTGQVLPELSRMMSRGDGTHRVTIKLNPEALGDVRVVLTVRQGQVHVRLNGAEAAQRALVAGAGELHRLLESAGATSTQVVVGDHTTPGPGSEAHTFRDHLGSQDGTHHRGGHGTDHRTAGTRDGDTSARDGAARGTRPRLPTGPGTRHRLTGVDVTM